MCVTQLVREFSLSSPWSSAAFLRPRPKLSVLKRGLPPNMLAVASVCVCYAKEFRERSSAIVFADMVPRRPFDWRFPSWFLTENVNPGLKYSISRLEISIWIENLNPGVSTCRANRAAGVEKRLDRKIQSMVDRSKFSALLHFADLRLKIRHTFHEARHQVLSQRDSVESAQNAPSKRAPSEFTWISWIL